MKFKCKEEPHFKTEYGTFEAGNSHDSDTLGIPEWEVLRWHQAGWVDAEGYEPRDRDPNKHIDLEADPVKIPHSDEV